MYDIVYTQLFEKIYKKLRSLSSYQTFPKHLLFNISFNNLVSNLDFLVVFFLFLIQGSSVRLLI